MPTGRAVAEVKSAVRIPVIVNGGHCGSDKRAGGLAQSGADAIMIGRKRLRPAMAGPRRLAEPWRAAKRFRSPIRRRCSPSRSII